MNFCRKKHHKLVNFYCIHLHSCMEATCIGFCAVSFFASTTEKKVNKIPTYRFTNSQILIKVCSSLKYPSLLLLVFYVQTQPHKFCNYEVPIIQSLNCYIIYNDLYIKKHR